MILQVWPLFGLVTSAFASPLSIRNNETNETIAWSFSDIPVSSSLNWVPCFNNFTCANLEVPLDYDDPSIGTTNVAFLRKSASQEPAKGDILINPGGPGGSGVAYTMQAIFDLERLLGTTYNIVGMDPRGVNNSGPNLDCFEGRPAVRDYYDTQYYADYDPKSDTSLVNQFQAAGGFGDWCSRTLKQDANYANTPATARDMLQYAEKLAESKGEDPDAAKVNYYGVSYGSTLGTTFAELFPNRVGRFIIDGVVDVEDHYGGSWTQNVLLADKAVRSFFKFCFEAGPACAFYRNDSSPEAIGRRFDAVLENVEKNPIPISDPAIVDFPVIIKATDIRGFLLLALYDANAQFQFLAQLFLGLEQNVAAFGTADTMPKAECNWDGDAYSSVQPKLLIACNDMNGRYNISTVDKWRSYVDTLEGISQYVGGVWASIITLQCRSLQFAPPENQVFKGFSKTTRTNTPMLFTSNRIDPVASSADKMAAFFPGSVVLKQDAVGHGLQVAKSNCTSGHLLKFLETGELPSPGIMCDVENKPFESPVSAKRRLLKRGHFGL
ncbi:alpha/beta-hydrolase [Lojkania enalia]|uniref:Alpha/beta-hydrolase n=1 Tax=Lojkania enalia TaxID=147567 RepID=A0A9P4MYY4_9PLEO|nr:alpha/beta-hydrolase [Didymosphaeria enalia]